MEGLKRNLLSLGQFDDLGYRMKSENRTLRIVRGALVIVKTEKIAENLYLVEGETLVRKLLPGLTKVLVPFCE